MTDSTPTTEGRVDTDYIVVEPVQYIKWGWKLDKTDPRDYKFISPLNTP